MVDPIAEYTFLPRLRRGLATEITRVEGDGQAATRAEIEVRLGVRLRGGGTDETRQTTTRLTLHGPGDIQGIDPRVVVRTHPRSEVHDAEPNYFAHVELDEPDFPWRFTPARASTKERLSPWLVLAVFAEDEEQEYRPAGGDGTLASVVVPTASLPPLSQSWAWAHAQVSGLGANETVASVVEREPPRAVSRLLCPRRLTPRTLYRACIVPAFEAGRLAGLREPLPDDLDGLAPAWVGPSGTVRLPIYFEWRFTTGSKGDFESLCRKLQPRRAGPEIGVRAMDAGEPGSALPRAFDAPMLMGGALQSVETEHTDWSGPVRDQFVDELSELANRPADLLEQGGARAVGPPLYGQTHAARDRLAPGERPPWFHTLNADPRHRVAAGLGTLVVQDQQRQLMASAWSQIGRINELNEEMRQAQLSRELSKRLKARHLDSLDVESTLLVTSPVHARVMGSPVTIRQLIADSPIAPGATEPQMRRVSRPRGPIGKKQNRHRPEARRELLERMNRGELSPAPPRSLPEDMATPRRSGEDAAPPFATPGGLRWLLWLLVSLILLALLSIGAFVYFLVTSGFGPAAAGALAAAVLVGTAAVGVRRRMARGQSYRALLEGKLEGDAFDTSAESGFRPALATRPGFVPDPALGTDDHETRTRLQTALTGLFDELSVPAAPSAPLRPVDLPMLRGKLLTALDPAATIPAALAQRVQLAPWVRWQPEDQIEPVMAAPEFPQPMYEPLRDRSQEWILPGVGLVPDNATMLLESAPAFIESYMAGLNHEMARELRWNEFPSDGRGTPFRQFWDVRGVIGENGAPADPETLRDIEPMHTWGSRSELGANSGRPPPPGGKHLVFMVKGEVLRRYPTTIVYAVEAVRDEQDRRTLGEKEKHPVFSGRLNPDIGFFGFELTAPQVRGGTDDDEHPGWFFVLQEQPTEPRFGLDVAGAYGRTVTSWNDLSWGDLVSSAEELDTFGCIDLDAQLPDTRYVATENGEPTVSWHADQGLGPKGSRSSDLAYITLQRPFRVAIHGSRMLPPEDGSP